LHPRSIADLAALQFLRDQTRAPVRLSSMGVVSNPITWTVKLTSQPKLI
jgi:hypothetical protein